ncbi:MAG: alpha,2-fucosyltransferase [Caulobacteraceae bacterium]|nr:alpha,2-fucosyltransferase [Caulobacteraceae bacterium]
MQGGIGNQLFCLAFAHSVAQLSGGPVAVDLAAFASSRYGHGFVLEPLALGLENVRLVDRGWLGSRPTTAVMRAAPFPGYVSEGAPPADEGALAALIARGRYFNGYWQNEAYIARPEEFVARTRQEVFRRAGAIPRRDVVIHYRTYKEEIRPGARRTPGGLYVRAALARIEATLGRAAEVCLVSDDPGLALRMLGDVGREITIAVGAGPWDDMVQLMTARSLVLTNSSFSWWGGFCGEAELAVYPRADGFFHYPAPAAQFACV